MISLKRDPIIPALTQLLSSQRNLFTIYINTIGGKYGTLVEKMNEQGISSEEMEKEFYPYWTSLEPIYAFMNSLDMLDPKKWIDQSIPDQIYDIIKIGKHFIKHDPSSEVYLSDILDKFESVLKASPFKYEI